MIFKDEKKKRDQCKRYQKKKKKDNSFVYMKGFIIFIIDEPVFQKCLIHRSIDFQSGIASFRFNMK